MIDLDTFIITSAAEKSTTGACEKGKIVVYFFGMSYRKGGRPAGRRRASMSDLREVLQENSYLRQKQLIFADCDRYQRARVSTLLSIAAAVAGAALPGLIITQLPAASAPMSGSRES